MNWGSQSPLFGEVEKDWFRLPNDVPVPTIFVDEGGAKNFSGRFFVVGLLKAYESAALDCGIRYLRQQHKFFEEMKFGGVKRESLRFFCDMAELAVDSGVRVGGSVYDSHRSFISRRVTREVQASMSAKLVVTNVNKGELVNVFLDLVQTPHGETMAARVRDRANQKLEQRAVLECYDLDSKSNNLLQVADVIAGSVVCARRSWTGDTLSAPGTEQTPKAKVAGHLRRALGLDTYDDVRADKVNVLTMNHG